MVEKKQYVDLERVANYVLIGFCFIIAFFVVNALTGDWLNILPDAPIEKWREGHWVCNKEIVRYFFLNSYVYNSIDECVEDFGEQCFYETEKKSHCAFWVWGKE